jgi:hypothetical protein
MKLIYPNHRFTPCATEVAARDRSNRLLDAYVGLLFWHFQQISNSPGFSSPHKAHRQSDGETLLGLLFWASSIAPASSR